MKRLAFVVALAPASSTARAEVGVRVGFAADLIYKAATQFDSQIHGITDFAPFEGQLMVSWWPSPSILSIDMELAGESYLNPGGHGVSLPRASTKLRPGIRAQPLTIPLYLRAAFPIHLGMPTGSSGGTYNLRLGLGLNVPLAAAGKAGLYVESDVDKSLDASSSWDLWLNVGLDFRF